MAAANEHHKELNENGTGKCSVPMWMGGLPAGFCDNSAYGEPPPCKQIWSHGQQRYVRIDGRYNGHVPHLACPAHGGPQAPEKEQQ